ncbi:MAG: hypothetical protein A2910_01995 [Candidatus Yanofskybacteria bacterium RIFCSPLOWO2_01_FULL_39_28]|nr:MAG: hypothetical protein A2910_01995 [Candidatus Yanofskybacteria bacterium RIFCSPLOWO2_01_FULL_39_28]
MADEEKTAENSISEENPSPASPQEPTEPAPENTSISEPTEAPSEALESSPNDFSVKSNDIPPPDFTPTEAVSEPKTEEKQAQNEADSEPVFEPKQTSEPQTAQIPVNEPLEESETSQNEQAKPVRENSKPSLARELLITARNAIQFRKRKKLDRVMSMFLQHSKITNDEVEKFLHVSDATATRYLSILEKEGKIKQNGKTGKGVSYSRI